MINIVKASAGSGKTYELTLNYLNLIFSKSSRIEDPYRHILAVTFTNKATEEMKSRILSTLFEISKISSETSKDSKILEIVRKILTNRGEEHATENILQLVKESKAHLINILQDYSSVNISTIDKFFQSVLRSFAREIGKNTTYNIELDIESVVNQSIENLYRELDADENREVLNWILNYSIDSIEEGQYWDLKSKIAKQTPKFILENYTFDPAAVEVLHKELRLIISEFRKRIKIFATRAKSIRENAGLEWSNFSGASKSSFNIFEKLFHVDIESIDSLLKYLEKDVSSWYSKQTNSVIKGKIELIYPELTTLLEEIKSHLSNYKAEYFSALLVKDNLMLGVILSNLKEQINNYVKEHNLMLLSDSNQLLKRIIDGSDTPFIYERYGIRLDHFLLDEFQDTSNEQWENFRPLVINSSSQGFRNLIVGDVKQSIYRWRNSDWTLLQEQIQKDFNSLEVKESTLSTNHRSAKNIVDFNNKFFEFVKYKLHELTNIYQDHNQDFHRNLGGTVKIKFLESTDGKKFKELSASYTLDYIKNLISRGYKYGDIGILVRTNKEGAYIISNILADPDHIPVISGDSLLLSESRSINTIVAILRLFHFPNDKISEQYLSLQGISSKDFKFKPFGQIFDLCNEIISKYFLNSSLSERAYIVTFLDFVRAFEKSQRSDLSLFLDWLDENLDKKSVSSPDNQDSIQVITIHKAKGLDFRVVILPFADWSEVPKSTDPKVLWIKSDKPPFNKIDYLPVKYSSKFMADSIFKEEYLKEKSMNLVDLINNAYVAFTRAKDEMLIISQTISEKSSSTSVTMSKLLNEFVIKNSNSSKNEEFVLGDYGQAPVTESNSEQSSHEFNLPMFSTPESSQKIELRNYEDDFSFNRAQARGKLLHRILSKVNSISDLQKSIKIFLHEGKISKEEAIEIESFLYNRITHAQVNKWFSGEYTVRNELEIFSQEDATLRPDRVMFSNDYTSAIVVDFKFGKPDPKHIKQVEKYTNKILESGIPNANGYVWYLEDNHIEEVR